MGIKSGDGIMKRLKRCWCLVPALAGLGLVAAVLAASASTTAPEAVDFKRESLSTPTWFGAYPDIDVGMGGLVAAVWTEGPDDVDKHSGRLKLAWANNNSTQWSVVTVDRATDGKVYDAAVAVSGLTIHVLWSQPKNSIRYATCNPPDYVCGSPDLVAVTGEEALQVDIAVDDAGTPHAVWVEAERDGDIKKRRVYHARRTGVIWSPKKRVIFKSNPGAEDIFVSDDGEGPSIAFANNFIHLVWTEWKDDAHTDSQVNYCRRSVSDSDWPRCVTPLSSWFTNYLARNTSIIADGDGNVYAVWDIVSQDDSGSRRKYAIAYKHATNNGDNWQPTHTYPNGSDSGASSSGATVFRSGEGDNWIEYLQFLRPHISLAVSGTQTVPVMSWHAQLDAGGGEEGLAQAVLQTPHKVFWTYATWPGSYSVDTSNGYMYWATDYYTISLDLCGDVNMNRDSATGQLAPAGDLKEILAGQSPGNHLHAVYHEETGGGFWGVYYNNGVPRPCFNIIMPVMLMSFGGGEE
jgi:hypothetical protein